jgi:hypothetical protein
MAEPDRSYRYRLAVLDELWTHGVHPTDRTRPELVHEFVSDLYRHQLRRLRQRLMRREFPKKDYAAQVISLRKRYRLISMPAAEWLEQEVL